MFEVQTIGLMQASYDGRKLAETVRSTDPMLADKLEHACDTLVSAAALIMRWEVGQVPLDVADAILLVNNELSKHR